jgi:hypothetical protein
MNIMSSPFPGMNPYLERRTVWHDFHEQFIAELREQLTPQIRPRYIAKLDEQVYVHELSAEERRLVGRPDIALVASGAALATLASPRVTAPATGLLPEPSVDTERLSYIEIRERESQRLVTAIEVLCPANKSPGPDRSQYLGKRSWFLAGGVNLVEIDLLRGRPRMPVDRTPTSDYLILVSRAAEKPQADLWPLSLVDPLPTIPIPLKPEEAEAELDLQAALHRAYDAAGYEDYIYDGLPEPELSPEQASWAKSFVPTPAS